MSVEGNALDFIREAAQGATLQEVCTHCGLERHTMTKYLESLRSQGLVTFKQVGMSKVWWPTKHPLIEVLKNDSIALGIKSIADDGEVAIVNKDFKVEWSNKGKTEKACHEVMGHSPEMCKNCPAHKAFSTGKSQSVTIKGQKVVTHPLKDEEGKVVSIVEVRK
ncbi:MAG: MarR family transcriptional regulator [Candidatus Woesearchaeota archaeon]|jgi:hypothetical protein|nr:MarR family transcriptional regulator [Candidatus Woesearchaeota archaeon]MDP7181094.1 MarR family transcriptional regulator [Candidatus Woesearchaeota archaeon]MDP7198285.1 MarR family transcriptional regulator [Candidatus Woesearchaeota archaeon]MDP7467387.1 MarR family transcriptional regulator [Candidatus Woesearchaeota archaeon]MDP7647614.1 MarR family transcriptional regulator [Candidatus Woesearchaeota archaeon]